MKKSASQIITEVAHELRSLAEKHDELEGPIHHLTACILRIHAQRLEIAKERLTEGETPPETTECPHPFYRSTEQGTVCDVCETFI